jgi:tol-pal system protein YbgF
MRPLACTIGVLILLLTGCASQRDVVTLDTRTHLLERRYAEMEKRYASLDEKLVEFDDSRSQKDQNLRSQSAELRAVLDQSREEMRELRGHMDEADHQLRQRLESMEQSLRQQDERLKKIEGYLGEPSAQQRPVAGAPPAAPPAEPSEEGRLYERAKGLFDQGKFAQAREVFQELLGKYPKSDQADNAQFWIGETYYREKWYEKAILEYQRVIDGYPRGNKVPSALLKQGMAFEELGDAENAQLLFKELLAKFPKSGEARVAADKIKP